MFTLVLDEVTGVFNWIHILSFWEEYYIFTTRSSDTLWGLESMHDSFRTCLRMRGDGNKFPCLLRRHPVGNCLNTLVNRLHTHHAEFENTIVLIFNEIPFVDLL